MLLAEHNVAICINSPEMYMDLCSVVLLLRLSSKNIIRLTYESCHFSIMFNSKKKLEIF